MSLPILQDAALRAIEADHASITPPLMERAGAGAARVAQEMLAGAEGSSRPILIVAGPGNNGGDAFVVARLLKEVRHNPHVLFAGDPTLLPGAARRAHSAWLAAGGTCLRNYPASEPGLIIDGLFGIGLDRPIIGAYADWIERMNACGRPVLALDVPSGLNAATGQATGPIVNATRTATFIALKPGLLTGDGPDHCGQITLCDLDLKIDIRDGEQITPELFQRCLQPRRRNSHKGSYGSVAIIGGAASMTGAALLAGRTALHLGAGRVYLGMLENPLVDHGQPELMLRAPAEAMNAATVLAIGPGLGQSLQAGELLGQALSYNLPLVLDADSLNVLTQSPLLLRKATVRPAPTFITPHPAEAARLLACSTDEVQADRLAAAFELARRLRAFVALKGCGTIVVAPDARWFMNTTGNPGLATAGSGDVLTGILAALLAQGWPPLEALLGAVHLHGAAADACVAEGLGPVGLTAGELIDPARQILNDWITPFGG
ncbi:MAG: NAD(P)H-hydrate dehydratase [Gammaproteobacteria bacterium]|nr:NAD(P)H-hydrate dehydratase [Rhodocyclaceae bacterium]MBU3910946.1 NAD(P)H-hydrate dehydratase [Gammaproteobacteria bacterium]MBU3989722.1 NAD(P)H-hydrate dehydratase [Gammaproteobacteria bacterium]MBU4003702.1 NAD(P)H-hydrate dehydratase [Gammaproteobacteria bacterium]MBU4098007.1 NAD(P)H-hydrate dehydratase [Gammaproteobacteria bacterium]